MCLIRRGSGNFDFETEAGRCAPAEFPGSWSDRWDQTEIIPLAISLEIDFEEEAHMEWPDLVASVRIDGLAIAEMIEEAGGRRPSEYSTTIQNLINRKKQF